jgi:hypothetical protein
MLGELTLDVTYLFEPSGPFCRWSLVQYTRWQIHVGRQYQVT